MSVFLSLIRGKTHYIKSTAPTFADGPIEVGTLWSDTTNNLLKRCTSTAPITFVSVEGGGGGGGAPTDATYIVQTADATLTNEQALGALGSGIVKNTTGTGVLSIAAAGTDYYAPGGTDVAIADGGTGQSTATAAFDALAPTTTQGDLIYHNGTDNVRLAKGTAGQALLVNAGATAPEWGRRGGQIISLGTAPSTGFAVPDATPFYFGLLTNPGLNPSTSVPTAANAIYPHVPTDCTIIAVYLTIISAPTGSAETGTGAIRVNNGTDNVVFNNTLQFNSTTLNYSATGLSIALSTGDFWSFKLTPPTFVTNPTSFFFGQVVVTFP